jgi:hypothetical protein
MLAEFQSVSKERNEESVRRGSEKDVCRSGEVVTNEKKAMNENWKSRDVDGEWRERERVDVQYRRCAS